MYIYNKLITSELILSSHLAESINDNWLQDVSATQLQNSFICSWQKAYVDKTLILQPHWHVWSTGHRVDQGSGHWQAKPTHCLNSTWLHWTKNLHDIWVLCLALFPDNGNSMLPKRWKHSINWLVCANILTSLEYLSTQAKPPALLPHTCGTDLLTLNLN